MACASFLETAINAMESTETSLKDKIKGELYVHLID